MRGVFTHVHRDHRGTRRDGAGALRALLLDLGETVFRSGSEMMALLGDAHPAARGVVALTNDLCAFHGATAMASQPFLAQADAVVDASVTGILKPDPRAYALAVEALDTPAGVIVFVDDMPWNVAGAAAAGMIAIELDLTEPDRAFAEARAALMPTRRTP